MKVAIVHDYLIANGGAEKVLRVFIESFNAVYPTVNISEIVFTQPRPGAALSAHRIQP